MSQLRLKKDIESKLKSNKDKMDDGEVFINEPEEQTDSFDVDSISDIQDYDDDYDDDDYDDFDEDYDDEPQQKGKPNPLKGMASNLNISTKAKSLIIIGLIGAVVFVLLVNPFKKDGEGEGLLSVLLGEPKMDMLATEEELYESNPELMILEELKSMYVDYDIVTDDENSQFSLTGYTPEGDEHQLTYSFEGELTGEVINGNAVDIAVSGDSNSGESTVESTATDGAQSEGGESGTTVILSDSTIVDKEAYDKSMLSMNEQKINPESMDRSSNTERIIVAYEKLPLKGRMPAIYCSEIEGDEKMIINIPIDQYMAMDDKGTTVIQFDAITAYGVITYENVTLVDWKN